MTEAESDELETFQSWPGRFLRYIVGTTWGA